jgi:eukaryotic-like serine/threonine-protein kinase
MESTITTRQWILSRDVRCVTSAELPQSLSEALNLKEGDCILFLPSSRVPEQRVDAMAMSLISEFQSSTTIIEAIIQHSRAKGKDPQSVLKDAFTLLSKLIASGVLIDSNSKISKRFSRLLSVGQIVLHCEVVDCLQANQSTEVYKVVDGSGTPMALKLFHSHYGSTCNAYERELAALQHLDNFVNPSLLAHGYLDGEPYTLTTWFDGLDSFTFSSRMRHESGFDTLINRLELGISILLAFSHLHMQNVAHGDVHPYNILINESGKVCIVDYECASSNVGSVIDRYGHPYFLEPEYARASLLKKQLPEPNALSEQYGLGALVYLLLVGKHHINLSPDLEIAFSQICNDPPLSFENRGVAAWPEVENILFKALCKDPKNRFASVADFASALKGAAQRIKKWFEQAQPSTIPRADLLEFSQNATRAIEEQHCNVFTSPIVNKLCCVARGGAGIAYALYRASMVIEKPRLLSFADLRITQVLHASAALDAFGTGLEAPKGEWQSSLYHSIAGVHMVHALIRHALGDNFGQQVAIETFCESIYASANRPIDLVLGNAGLLLGCAALLETCPYNPSLLQLGRILFADLCLNIENSFSNLSCISWNPSCDGIAHGQPGILYAALRWCLASGTDSGQLLQYVLALTNSFSLQEKVSQMSWGWCNGSAGRVHLWLLAYVIYNDALFLKLADKEGQNTWSHPAPVPYLCCGLSGQAYALIALYKATGDLSWLLRAKVLAFMASERTNEFNNLDGSLFWGSLGVALLGCEMSRPAFSCMPLFESEGWV